MSRGQFGIDDNPVFVIDQSRCIGCEACVQACAECGTHRGQSLIHLERVDRATSTQTAPMVCMHCEDPTCAQVCPADAIKQTEEGIVQSALKPRCIGCSNCVLACPFGVPKYVADFDQMMKCDMCTDRTSEGLAPMCASVCPSEALWYGTIEEFNDTRSGSLFRDFMFGRQEVRTKVYTVIDDALGGPLDVLAGSSTLLARRPVRTRASRASDDRTTSIRSPWRHPGNATSPTRRSVRGGGHAPRVRPLPRPRRRHDGGRQRRDRSMDAAAQHQRRGTTGDHRARGRRGRRDLPVPLSRLTTTPRSSSASSDTEVVAFSQKCTHLGCVVYYEPDEQRWHCPCHEGNFEVRTGAVISGPPTRPLGRIDLEVRDDGMIWALGRQT